MIDPTMIRPGYLVVVLDANGQEHTMLALSGLYRGRDFPVVRVRQCDAPADDPGIPWPAESIVGFMSMPSQKEDE